MWKHFEFIEDYLISNIVSDVLCPNFVEEASSKKRRSQKKRYVRFLTTLSTTISSTMSSSSENSSNSAGSNTPVTSQSSQTNFGGQNRTNGAQNIRVATDALAQHLESGNATLQEANTDNERSPDVLFRGSFTQGFPSFSVTIDRTNITSDGAVVGEPVFNFGNLPNNLRDMVQSLMESNRPRKKKATKDAIKRLKIIDPTTLKESERVCSICYDKFDQPKNEGRANDSKPITISINDTRELLTGDPPIIFPKDPTGSRYSEYHRLAKQSKHKDTGKEPEDNGQEGEHIPVQMPCGHIFGRSCLLEWLKSNISCPLCRREVEAQPVQATEEATADQRFFRNRSICPATWSASDNLYEDPEIPFPPTRRSRISIFNTALN